MLITTFNTVAKISNNTSISLNMNINTTRNCGMVEYYSALRKSNITPFVQHSTRGYHAK